MNELSHARIDAPAPMPPLSAQDQHHLDTLELKFQLVRDRTAAVAAGYSTGFYLFGEGGIGKSYTVLGELNRRQTAYHLHNSRMTGRGLFDALERAPDVVHVLEDMEPLLLDRTAQGVLRSALWAQRRADDPGPLQRPVTWTTHRQDHSFVFTGGVIILSNRPMADLPELNAVATRIAVMHLHASDDELRALMRKVARGGFQHRGKRLGPDECVEVCDFLIEQSLAMRRPLDMRLLTNSFEDYLQWQEGDAATHWHDLVNSRLHQRATVSHSAARVGRTARKEEELEMVREIAAATNDRGERIRLWHERTGKSQAAFYRRLAELRDRQECIASPESEN